MAREGKVASPNSLGTRHRPTTGCEASAIMALASGVASWAVALWPTVATRLRNNTTTTDTSRPNRRIAHPPVRHNNQTTSPGAPKQYLTGDVGTHPYFLRNSGAARVVRSGTALLRPVRREHDAYYATI